MWLICFIFLFFDNFSWQVLQRHHHSDGRRLQHDAGHLVVGFDGHHQFPVHLHRRLPGRKGRQENADARLPCRYATYLHLPSISDDVDICMMGQVICISDCVWLIDCTFLHASFTGRSDRVAGVPWCRVHDHQLQ